MCLVWGQACLSKAEKSIGSFTLFSCWMRFCGLELQRNGWKQLCGPNGRTSDTRWAAIEMSLSCRSWQKPDRAQLLFASALLQFPQDVAVWAKAKPRPGLALASVCARERKHPCI